jgi:uroporphyrinogen III methyltransferase/synthase
MLNLKRPKVLITKPQEEKNTLKSILEEAGIQVLWIPTIKITPLEKPPFFEELVEDLSSFDWVVFTSKNGVKIFFERYLPQEKRHLLSAKIAAIGPGTAKALLEYGQKADLTPSAYDSETLACEMLKRGVEGKKVLLLRAKEARPILREKLTQGGAEVTEIHLYKVEMPPELPSLLKELEGVDLVVFTSAQAVHNFFKALSRNWPSHLQAAVIGPITAQALKKYGIEPKVMPQEYTLEALASSIIDYFSKGGESCVNQPLTC